MAVYGNTLLSEGSLLRYPSCASMDSKLKHAFLGRSLFDIQEVNDIYKTQEVKKMYRFQETSKTYRSHGAPQATEGCSWMGS